TAPWRSDGPDVRSKGLSRCADACIFVGRAALNEGLLTKWWSGMSTMVVELECSALGERVVVLGARGVEGINEMSAWTLDILSPDGPLPLEDALGAGATLSLVDTLEEHARSIGLIVMDIAFESEGRDGYLYTLTLVPAEALLRERSGYRIFLEKTVQEI